MIKSFFDSVVSLDEAVSVTIPQVELGLVLRLHIIAQLPGVVKEASLRVQRKDSNLHRLSVLREHALVQLCACTQGARDARVVMKTFLSACIIIQVSVSFPPALSVAAAASRATLHVSYNYC